MEEIGAAAAVLGEKLSLVIVTNINFPDFEFVNQVDLTKVVASFHNFNLKLEEKANNVELNFRGWKKYPFSVFGVWVVGLSEGQVHNLGWQNT